MKIKKISNILTFIVVILLVVLVICVIGIYKEITDYELSVLHSKALSICKKEP